jgi:hypothetical protein
MLDDAKQNVSLAHKAVGNYAKSSDATASNALRAHCAHNLFNDIPDATAAETACYDSLVDGGSSHSQAVLEIKAKRNPMNAKASAKPTVDSIYAAHESALTTANKLAEETGHAKLTADDVFRDCCTVTATGTGNKQDAATILETLYARAGASR